MRPYAGLIAIRRREDMLRDATVAHQARERDLLAKIATLERRIRSLELDLSLARRERAVPMPSSCYRDPRTADALPMRVGHRGKRTAPVKPMQEVDDV